ncbi:Hypothetical predicted protein [Mytilus galloprovincialis]|uniref:Uncharacterized protein n=1 Tax=Mytilus galloprovincialis TaxID=29158 RepID=A0A8B6D1P3_MYTGA|nr:Hypothetical predicted protein [Mytilus galloprovincialis]
MSAKWYPLDNFICPVKKCTDKTTGSWVCSSDRTRTYISQTGYIRCGTWNHHDLICNWGWNCGSHGNHSVDKYKKADAQGFSFALSQAVSLLGEAGSTWVAALANEIGNQFDRR